MKRREFLKLAVEAAAGAAWSSYAMGEAGLKEIRIGTQKGGFFPAVRQRHTIENAFKPLDIDIKWIDFQFGPPLLEAINVGSVDFGYVGDTPPIFAQAAGARIRYVAAVKSDGNTQAIVVPQDSPIKTLADLKGKRIAFGKGSSAHNLLVAALEKAGLISRQPGQPRHILRRQRQAIGDARVAVVIVGATTAVVIEQAAGNFQTKPWWR